MMPQFHSASCRFDKENFAVGLTLLSFGLFKKVVLADNIATVVTPIYNQAASGGQFLCYWRGRRPLGSRCRSISIFRATPTWRLAWLDSLESDCRRTSTRRFRPASIIDFWLRWHMTLTRFLTAYIYNPLTLWLTRRRLAKGAPALAAETRRSAHLSTADVSLLLTMFVSGLWHGAGYGFIIWGLLHGVYLTVNHAWRLIRPRLWPDTASYERFMKPVGGF